MTKTAKIKLLIAFKQGKLTVEELKECLTFDSIPLFILKDKKPKNETQKRQIDLFQKIGVEIILVNVVSKNQSI